ncbi:Scr1 family TA system antitoxin-like transcriptional regulator [Streptomyces sp. NPDC055642]
MGGGVPGSGAGGPRHLVVRESGVAGPAPDPGVRAGRVEQLQSLRQLTGRPAFTLQVLPLGRTSHPALDGPFVLLETPDYQRLAYTETQRGSQLIADPNEVAILTQRCAMLRTQALNAEDTRDLLDRLLGEA